MSLFTAGLRIHDRYTLIAPVGAGGMSEVWRATDELLGRPVAVKALATQLADDPALRELTWREARAVARLNHPNVTQVHDYGEVRLPAGGVAGYLVMELVDGQTLAARLAGGPLPWPVAIQITRQVAAALVAAHQLGVVHRDIKPGNVMLTEAGVKVLDFGIAAVAGRTDTDPHRLVGTPTYAAPERLDVTVPAQPASDIYSLGVLLYEALVGRPPFALDSWSAAAATHRAGAAAAPPSVAGLPAAVARLCGDCRAADPAQRPNAGQVVAALTAVLAEAGPATGAESGSLPPTAVAGLAGSSSEPATVVAPGRYAAGAAALPAAGVAATRIEAPPDHRRHHRRWWRLAGAGVAVLVTGALLVLAVAAVRPGDGTAPGAAGAASAPASAAVGSSAPPTTSQPVPTEPVAVIHALDQAIGDAFTAGDISRDAFDDLRDELDDLRDALAEEKPEKRAKKLREEAEDFLEEVEDLLEDGEVDPATARQLTELLTPLLTR